MEQTPTAGHRGDLSRHSRIHFRRPPRSGTARVALRPVLRGSARPPIPRSGASGTRIGRRPTRRGRRWRSRTCSSRWRRTSAASCTRLFDVEREAAAHRAGDARPGRSVPLQGRLRPPPRAAAAERRTRTSLRRAETTIARGCSSAISSRRTRIRHPNCQGSASSPSCARARRLRAARSREGRQAPPSPAEIEALKRWCAARAPRSARIAAGSSSGFPRTLELLASRRGAAARAAAARSDARARRAAAPPRRLQADRPAHEAARGAERDPLLRALPRARQGLVLEGLHDKDGKVAVNPLGIELDRLPARREDLRDARAAQGAATRSARWRSSSIDNPMCPGTGHRICNDCMKSCIYQKQEPVNIPQIETGVLTDVLEHAVGRRDLRAAHALESAQRPPAVRAAVQRQERARRRPRPGRLHAGALPAQRRLRRRRHRRAEDRAAAGGHRRRPTRQPPRPIRDWSEIYQPLDERVLEGFGGVSEYGITVRWDKNFLTLLHLTLARRRRAADLRRRPLRRHAADRGRVGATGSITSRSPPAPAGRRSST